MDQIELLGAAGDSIAVVNVTDHTIAYWSPAAERISGYSPDEATGKCIYELVTPATWSPSDWNRARADALVERVRRDGRVEQSGPRRRKDGTTIWVESTVSLSSNGEQLVVVTRDVSARKAAEEERAIEAARARAYYELAGVGFATTADGPGFIEVNDTFCRMLGYSHDELVALGWAAVTHPDDRAVAVDLAGRLRSGASDAITTRRRYVRKDGSILHAQLSLSRAELPDGRTLQIACILDISAQHKAEEMLRATISEIVDGVVVRDREGRLEMVNRAAAPLLGMSDEQLAARVGPPGWRMLGEDGRELAMAQTPAELARLKGETVTRQVVGVELPSGERRWFSVSAAPLGSGHPPFDVVVTFHDLTELREKQAIVRTYDERLRRVVDASCAGIFEEDIATGRVEGSSRVAEILGLPPVDFTATFDDFLVHLEPETAASVAAERQQIIRGERAFHDRELRVTTADGTSRWVHLRAHRTEGRNGPCISGVITDITTRREAEEKAKEQARRNEALVLELKGALDHVKQLTGLLPICMFCHKIRDDRGYWEQLERYISARSDARFSHGLCPECEAAHYPDGEP